MNADEIVRIDEAVKALHRLSELLVTPDSIVCCEAAELIESLQAQLAERDTEIERLREARRWIPVTEKLPENSKNCLVFARDGYRNTGIDVSSYINGGWFLDWHYGATVTHWMPLPAAPEEGAEK